MCSHSGDSVLYPSALQNSSMSAYRVGVSTVRAVCRAPSYGYRLPYWWTLGAVTTVAGIRRVVNRILPYFNSRKRPSYGSKYKTILRKLLCTNALSLWATCAYIINDEKPASFAGGSDSGANNFLGRPRDSVLRDCDCENIITDRFAVHLDLHSG
jgi:hypothetical protein